MTLVTSERKVLASAAGHCGILGQGMQNKWMALCESWVRPPCSAFPPHAEEGCGSKRPSDPATYSYRSKALRRCSGQGPTPGSQSDSLPKPSRRGGERNCEPSSVTEVSHQIFTGELISLASARPLTGPSLLPPLLLHPWVSCFIPPYSLGYQGCWVLSTPARHTHLSPALQHLHP